MSLRPVTAPPGNPPAGLGQGRQVGGDAVFGLRPARRHAKAGDDLVEDQQHAVLAGQFAQRVQECGSIGSRAPK